jgi:penicillin-binding protein 1B
LRAAGFGEQKDTPKGRYEMVRGGVRIYPGSDSYFSGEPAELDFADGKLSSITSLKDQFARGEYSLEPELITNLFDSNREKRRLVRFQDLPKNLVAAVLSIEDRRFFEHSGFDYLRLIRAGYVDITKGSARQGASTLTQQLARSLFLTLDKTMSRKAAEAMVAFQLERRLTKEEIFESYCNTVYLGQRGSFSIQGMGEGAQVYFRKDVRDLSLPEAALLAGTIQSPNRYSPYHNEARATKRRNQVLDAMLETQAITKDEHDKAVKAPLGVTPSYEGATEALLRRHGERPVARSLFGIVPDFAELSWLHHAGHSAATRRGRGGAHRRGRTRQAHRFPALRPPEECQGCGPRAGRAPGDCPRRARSAHRSDQSSRRRARLRRESAQSHAR